MFRGWDPLLRVILDKLETNEKVNASIVLPNNSYPPFYCEIVAMPVLCMG